MEREQYQNQIKDLLQAVETLLKSNNAMGERVAQLEKLLKSNNAMGERVAQLEKMVKDYEDLKAASKRMESQTGSDYPECEQAR